LSSDRHPQEPGLADVAGGYVLFGAVVALVVVTLIVLAWRAV
jgi:hypothetical protein